MSKISATPTNLTSNGLADELEIQTTHFKLKIGRAQFQHQSDPEVQRVLFATYVKRIVIETSSFCNRRCVFCPNSDGSRIGAQRLMSDRVFRTVIDDLAEINFSGSILLHLYNEPLADPDIFSRIAYARSKLPKTALSFNSNGDYIRPDTLRRLAEAGLTRLHVSIYGPKHGIFERDYVEKRLQEMAKLCALSQTAVWISDVECRVTATFTDGARRLPVTIQARDFNRVGYDRGGLVDLDIDGPADRAYPCPSPFDEFLLTWNGAVVPCCNIIGDRLEHQEHVMGHITGPGSIFTIYADSPLVEWRRSLMRFAPHTAPCTKCTRLSAPVIALDKEHRAFNAAVDGLIAATNLQVNVSEQL